MKYWFFDGNDVIGPFSPQDLVAHKAFNAVSLICPESFSDDGDHWQPAVTFDDLKPLLAKQQPEPEDNEATLEQEMDTLLKERSPLSFDETPTDGPELQIPKKPSKPGPIEEYFNNIKKEDLGDILGIPDPNDNSDMDLAHALETQLAKTSSTKRDLQNTWTEPPADPTPLEATHHVASVTEVFATPTSTALPQPMQAQTMPTVPSPYMPQVATPAAITTDQLQGLRPLQENLSSTSTIAPTTQDTASNSSLPPTQTPAQLAPQPQAEPVQIIPDPALLRAEQVEVNSVRPRLKQTQEMKDFLKQTQNDHLQQMKAQTSEAHRSWGVFLCIAILGALLFAVQFATTRHSKQTAPTSASIPTTQEILAEGTTPVVAPAPDAAPMTEEQKALQIVQHYQLPQNKGTLADYLNRIYRAQLAQGYSAKWETEPLYKNTYIVKYRLTKTRKEPIIYVFQANVATNKLTGALNNISLDLVGKI